MELSVGDYVDLGDSSGSPSAAGRLGERRLEQAERKQFLEVERGEFPRDPSPGGRLLARNRSAGFPDDAVEAASNRVLQRGHRLEIALPHEATLVQQQLADWCSTQSLDGEPSNSLKTVSEINLGVQMSRFVRVLVLVSVLIPALLASSASAAACVHSSYSIIELPGLGGPVTQGVAIAENGVAAGWGLDSAWVSHALRWSNGQVTGLSSSSSAGTGISSNGVVAGWQSGRRGGMQATTWSPAIALKAPRDSIGAQAADVNNGGIAVGWSANSIGDTVAVRWDGTRATVLSSGAGAPYVSLAFAVNDAGTIIGRGDFGTAPFRRALSWSGTSMTTLKSLGGGVDSATAISQSGLITGAGLSPVDAKFHGVVWSGNSVTDLGLFGSAPTQGNGVNSCGTVVGEAVTSVALEITEAVMWQGGGQAVALEAMLPPGHGWDLHIARAINDTGQIVGHGFRSGQSGLRAFLMTPAS